MAKKSEINQGCFLMCIVFAAFFALTDGIGAGLIVLAILVMLASSSKIIR